MTAIFVALFSSGALKWIAAAATAIGALVVTWLHGKSTGKAQSVEQVKVAQVQMQAAQMSAADSKADAEQAKQEVQAAKVFTQAQSDASQKSEPELDAEASQLGILRKD